MQQYERSVYSQQGEDGVLQHILSVTGEGSRTAVEFGATDGVVTSNTKALEDRGWQRWLFDSHPGSAQVIRAMVLPSNIDRVFEEWGVPRDLAVLSIDTDFLDWWIWRALSWCRPMVVITEYNAHVPPSEARVVVLDETRGWDGTDYFGGSLLAFDMLARKKGYRLVYCESHGVNAFWVREDCLNGLEPLTVEQAYRSPNYYGQGWFHPKSKETMRLITEEDL